MAIYAFDGTWNTDKSDEDPQYQNTNVVRFHDAYTKNSATKAFDYYVQGVGTRFDLAGKALGGVFGLGELPRIAEAYDRQCQAWAGGTTLSMSSGSPVAPPRCSTSAIACSRTASCSPAATA